MNIIKDLKCRHENFFCTANVIRLQEAHEAEPHGYIAEVQIQCAECKQDFYFQGLPFGVYNGKPSISFLGNEARLPITTQPFHELNS